MLKFPIELCLARAGFQLSPIKQCTGLHQPLHLAKYPISLRACEGSIRYFLSAVALEVEVSRKRFLIVDDHPDVARAVVALARGLGYDAESAFSGDEALASLGKFVPDLLFLDLQMPGVSGWDVLRLLRADPRFDRMPIIACSASDSPTYREQAIAAGAQDYLHKHRAFEDFQPALRRQLDDTPAFDLSDCCRTGREAREVARKSTEDAKKVGVTR